MVVIKHHGLLHEVKSQKRKNRTSPHKRVITRCFLEVLHPRKEPLPEGVGNCVFCLCDARHPRAKYRNVPMEVQIDEWVTRFFG